MENRMVLTHNEVLSAFNENYYKDLILMSNLGDETVIKYRENQKFVYPVKHKGKVYAIPTEIVEGNKLPIRITNTDKMAYRSIPYYYVKSFASARISEVEEMSFRDLIDSIADFTHTHKDSDFLIYKIVILTGYFKKVFLRCVSEAGFGKNSIPSIIKTLMTDVSVMNPRTTPAFESKLIHRLIILDELTNLESSQTDLLQEALLRVGDFCLSYEKGSRGSAKFGTKDEYDISKLSVIIIYNVYEYYASIGKGNKYFDFIFQPAVKDRFFPIYLEGNMDALQFTSVKNPKDEAKKHEEDIKKILRTIKFYQLHFDKKVSEKNFKLDNEYRLSKTGRHDITFNVLCQGLKLYAKDEIEYNNLVKKLVNMYHKYKNMIKKINEVEEEDYDEVKAKDKKPKSVQNLL